MRLVKVFIIHCFVLQTLIIPEPTPVIQNKTVEEDIFGHRYYSGNMPPRPIVDFDLKPFFPTNAIKAGITDKTIIAFVLIDATGKLKSIKIISKKDKYGFDEAAIKILKLARFSPGYKNGKPIQKFHKIPIHFELEE